MHVQLECYVLFFFLETAAPFQCLDGFCWCIFNLIVSYICHLADEDPLKNLCLISSGIHQLTISTTRGNFTLGSGDATLIVDDGAVQKTTVVQYAVILHGPFVYSAGYKPASVVVYLNLEGATLLKPIKLMLKHWCKSTEVINEAVLRLLRAPHTIGEMQNLHYVFHQVEGTSSPNTSTFTISEPQCLYCVEMKVESQASYNAVAFQKDLPNLVKFKIQFMCDSSEWNEVSSCTVLRGNRCSSVYVSVTVMFAVPDNVPGKTRMGE